MKNYLLNVWSSGNFEKLSKDEMNNFFNDFGTWVKTLEEKDQLVTRHRIAGEFKSVQYNSDKAEISDTPAFGGKNGLAGTFIIQTESAEEAYEIAKACPPAKHLKDTVEIVELAI